MANNHGGARIGAGRPKDSKSARSRFQAAQAAKEEHLAELRRLQVERERGQLVPRQAIITTWQGVFTVVRNRLLAMPAKIAGEAAHQDAATVAAIVKREVHQALRELANTDGMPQEPQHP